MGKVSGVGLLSNGDELSGAPAWWCYHRPYLWVVGKAIACLSRRPSSAAWCGVEDAGGRRVGHAAVLGGAALRCNDGIASQHLISCQKIVSNSDDGCMRRA
jgi:hypothetical protein